MFPLRQTCENHLCLATGNFLGFYCGFKNQRNKHISTPDLLNHHQMRMGLKQHPLTWQSQSHRLIYDPSLSDLPGMHVNVGMGGTDQQRSNNTAKRQSGHGAGNLRVTYCMERDLGHTGSGVNAMAWSCLPYMTRNGSANRRGVGKLQLQLLLSRISPPACVHGEQMVIW